MAVKLVGPTRERVEGIFLVAMVVLVQVAWGAALVYLVLHFA